MRVVLGFNCHILFIKCTMCVSSPRMCVCSLMFVLLLLLKTSSVCPLLNLIHSTALDSMLEVAGVKPLRCV